MFVCVYVCVHAPFSVVVDTVHAECCSRNGLGGPETVVVDIAWVVVWVCAPTHTLRCIILHALPVRMCSGGGHHRRQATPVWVCTSAALCHPARSACVCVRSGGAHCVRQAHGPPRPPPAASRGGSCQLREAAGEAKAGCGCCPSACLAASPGCRWGAYAAGAPWHDVGKQRGTRGALPWRRCGDLWQGGKAAAEGCSCNSQGARISSRSLSPCRRVCGLSRHLVGRCGPCRVGAAWSGILRRRCWLGLACGEAVCKCAFML